ncbi:cation:proton antiporter [Staphylococcus felis]|uniref:cation:proton antiporter n=1 Tax=Staphylococcus felis TaxID=46127 RepID=UPI000CD192AD|nr:sodium:proton antiporter [Staphylococcus felis]AVP36082.1 sodium:proton antiporter [Staphylococcus felis]PNZ36110.1 sodium:proton antiporter [Staphylococcus felis]QQB03947.1 sodium:proton antiporter [Staphylococcus felis]
MNLELPLTLSLVLFLTLGILSQWIANLLKWPAIVVMAIVGLLVGPIFGLVNPQEHLGHDIFSTIVSLAVAIILFEGSSNLDFRELKGVSKALVKILSIGAAISWFLGMLGLHYILSFPLSISAVLAGLFLISGPTVIQPLLKQTKVKNNVDTILRWESIILDPIGPMVALGLYFIIFVIKQDFGFQVILVFLVELVAAALIGILVAYVFKWLVEQNRISQNLIAPIQFVCVLLIFSISDFILPESGLLTVTVFGLCIAMFKRGDFIYSEPDHFIEHTSMILVSTVFILITSSLTMDVLKETFNWWLILFCFVMIVCVRPISIFVATLNTEIASNERRFLSAIMPRGIVVLTVAEFFSTLLIDANVPKAEYITSVTFGFVFITVVFYGFSFKTIAKRFKVSSNEPSGVLLVGESAFSNHLGTVLKQHHIPIMVFLQKQRGVTQTEALGFETFEGNLLAHHERIYADLTRYDYSLLLTSSLMVNAYAFTELTNEFGLKNVFMVDSSNHQKNMKHRVGKQISNHILFKEGVSYQELNQYVKTKCITEIDASEQSTITDDDLLLYYIDDNKEIAFQTVNHALLGKETGIYGVLKHFHSTISSLKNGNEDQ